MVADMGSGVVFVVVKAGILSVPLAAMPMAGLVLVHVKVVAVVVLEKVVAGSAIPEQYVTSAGTITVGVGLTVMV